MSTVIARPLDLDTIDLATGAHKPPAGNQPPEGCLLELCAYMAGEDWTDHPRCVCEVLGAFGRRLNDLLPHDKRQQLKALIPAMLNTAGDGLAETRRWMSTDWAVRTAAPLWMDAADRAELAAELRAMPPIVDRATFDAVYPRLDAIYDACYTARREALDGLRVKVRAAVTKALGEGKEPVAVAVAVAAAVAVAVADAAAVAAAVAAAAADAAAVAAAVAAAAADAVAVAAAAADAAAAAARGTDRWWQIRDRVYRQVYDTTRARIADRYAVTVSAVHDSAIDLFARMVRPSA